MLESGGVAGDVKLEGNLRVSCWTGHLSFGDSKHNARRVKKLNLPNR